MQRATTNLMTNIPAALPAELFETLAEADGVRIERIISRGHATPPGEWLDQADTEWVMLVAGQASILFEGEPPPRLLTPGDHLTIPPHTRHRVESTASDQTTIWLAVHYQA